MRVTLGCTPYGSQQTIRDACAPLWHRSAWPHCPKCPLLGVRVSLPTPANPSRPSCVHGRAFPRTSCPGGRHAARGLFRDVLPSFPDTHFAPARVPPRPGACLPRVLDHIPLVPTDQSILVHRVLATAGTPAASTCAQAWSGHCFPTLSSKSQGARLPGHMVRVCAVWVISFEC